MAALHLARDLTVPVALALFFAVILSPAVERLRRLGLPNGIAAAIVMLAVLGVLAALVNVTVDPAREWFDRAPRLLSEVEAKFRPLRQVSVQIDQVAAQAERVTGGTVSTAPAAYGPNRGLLWKTPTIVVPVAGVFFLTLFILASGPPLLARLGSTRRSAPRQCGTPSSWWSTHGASCRAFSARSPSSMSGSVP